MEPPPGRVTERHLIQAAERDHTLYELVDGTLVEKGLGFLESCLAVAIVCAILDVVRPNRLGKVSGADGPFRLSPGLVRVPDVAFASWDRFPGRRVPRDPIPDLVPDLAVEVLNLSSTEAEMRRKRAEYFRAGVRLVWEVDPRARTVQVYTPRRRRRPVVLTAADTLDGGKVLPGFRLPLAELFAELDE